MATTPPCAVLIAAPQFLPTLKQRTGEPRSEVLTFSDADALRALGVIFKRRPGVVALERAFAETPRGAALINRIKADPALARSEIRLVSHDSDDVRVLPRKVEPAAPSPIVSVSAECAPALDLRGTRRAERFRMRGQVDVLIDGNSATLVDLSVVGAQVISATILKPNQRVRMVLPDETDTVRFNTIIAWASFEIQPQSGPRYRAGIEFVNAEASAVGTFCERHKTR
jgi:hypothetical protein